MNALKRPDVHELIVLHARTAEDLMTGSPVSIEEDASVREAIAFMIDRHISGMPVIDAAGRPVGVLTRTDILVHDREHAEHLAPAGVNEEPETGSPLTRKLLSEFQIERVDPTPVRDVMTPVVISVPLTTPATDVIERMLTLDIHRLFVVDSAGVLVGVITPLDVLRRLRAAR